MKILIVANTTDSEDFLRDLLSRYTDGERNSIAILTVLEPCLVVDRTLSSAGTTKFRQILEERFAQARKTIDELSSTIFVDTQLAEDVRKLEFEGDMAQVAVLCAKDLKSDLMLICDPDISRKSSSRLVAEAPCSVIFVKDTHRRIA